MTFSEQKTKHKLMWDASYVLQENCFDIQLKVKRCSSGKTVYIHVHSLPLLYLKTAGSPVIILFRKEKENYCSSNI